MLWAGAADGRGRGGAGLPAELILGAGAVDGLDEERQLVVYRVVQEGLSNVARHAGATGVRVSVFADGAATVVRIDDDGLGFEPRATPPGLGLSGMRERAVLAGGRLDVRSAPGRVTLVELRLEGR